MKKLWKNFSSAYPMRVLTTTSISIINLLNVRRAERQAGTRNLFHVINALFVLVLIFCGDRFLASVLEQVNLSSHFRFSKLYKASADSDIVLIGNSRGHTFYQPAIRKLTGASTINLSHNALPVSIANALVQDFLDLHKTPRKIVVEISMLTKTEEKVINEFKLYMDQSGRIREVVKTNSPTVAAAVSVSNLYSFNTELFHRSLYYLGKEDSDWILDKKINDALVRNAGGIEPMTFSITADRLNDLGELVRRAREEGVEVSLVLAPFYPAYREKIANLGAFITEVEKRTGLIVHDYSDAIEEDKYFSDYLHLNKAGSVLFMERLKADRIF